MTPNRPEIKSLPKVLPLAVIESMNDEVIVIDEAYRIVLANQKKRDAFPEAGDLVGKYCYSVFEGRTEDEGPCEDCPTAEAFLDKTIGPVWHEYNLSGDPAQRRACGITAAPAARDKEGKVTHVVEVVRDQTYRKKLDEATLELEKTLDIRNVYDIVLNAVRNLGFDRVRFYALSREQDLLVGRRYIGLADTNQETLFTSGALAINLNSKENAHTRLVLKRKAPIIFRRSLTAKSKIKKARILQEGPRLIYGPVVDPLETTLNKEDVDEWLELPLQVGKETFGLISVDRIISKRTIEDWEYHLVSTFCRLAAQAIANAQSHTELRLYSDITKLFRQGTAIEDIMKETLKQVTELISAGECCGHVRLVDAEGKNLVMCAGIGDYWSKATHSRPWGEPVSGKVAKTQDAIIVHDSNKNGGNDFIKLRTKRVAEFLKHERSFACLPLLFDNETIGTMALSSRVSNVFVGYEHFLDRLASIAAQITYTASLQGEREIERALACIRRQDTPTLIYLTQTTKKVAKSCQALGCTLFLKTTLLPLVSEFRLDEDMLRRAFHRFFIDFQKEEKIKPEGVRNNKLRNMFCSFLGVDKQGLSQVLNHPGAPQDLARLIGDSLYLPVAQSANRSIPNKAITRFGDIVSGDKQADSTQLIRMLLEESYLPGYGLTGWVLRNKIPLFLPNREGSAIEEFYRDLSQATTVPPVVSAIVRTLKNYDVYTKLDEYKRQPPERADHLKDARKHQETADAYVAYPLEEIDTAELPGGVLRASTTHHNAAIFGPLANAAMQDTARHLSWILRRAYMMEGRHVTSHSEAEALRDYVYHKINRYRPLLDDLTVKMEQEEIKPHPSIEKVKNAMTELCISVEHIQKQYESARKLRRAPTITYEILKDCIKTFLPENQGNVAIRVEINEGLSGPISCPTMQRCALNICLLTEEIVRNDLRHNQIPKDHIDVVIKDTPIFCIEIRSIPINCEVKDADENLFPYNLLLESGTRYGGGRRLWHTVTMSTDLRVWYCKLGDGMKYVINCNNCLEQSSLNEKGVKNEET